MVYGKTALVLSGGGAKGAYEVGVYQALEKFGITPYIDAFVGTSVGALNAVLFETSPNPENVWLTLQSSDLLNLDNEQADNFRTQFSAIKSHITGIIDRWTSPEIYDPDSVGKLTTETISKYLPAYMDLANKGLPFSQDKISELIDKEVNFSRIRREIVIICTRMNLQFTTQAFYINEYRNFIKKQIVLASSAYPGVYCGAEGVEISGEGKFFDGGFRHKGNIPVSFVPKKYDRIIVVHLRNNPDINRQPELMQNNVINIIPSRSLGSTLYLSPSMVKNNIACGFSDTLSKLDEIEKLLS